MLTRPRHGVDGARSVSFRNIKQPWPQVDRLTRLVLQARMASPAGSAKVEAPEGELLIKEGDVWLVFDDARDFGTALHGKLREIKRKSAKIMHIVWNEAARLN